MPMWATCVDGQANIIVSEILFHAQDLHKRLLLLSNLTRLWLANPVFGTSCRNDIEICEYCRLTMF